MINDRISLTTTVDEIMERNPKFIIEDNYDTMEIMSLREQMYKVLPVLSIENEIIDILNFNQTKTILPIDVVVMAGGEGKRLRPITHNIPKPMIKIGDTPILEHHLNSFYEYGIKKFFWITTNYLSNQISDYFKDGKSKGLQIDYIKENKPLGTVGAVSLIKNFNRDNVLITNSDLFSKINYEDFYIDFLKSESDILILSIPMKFLSHLEY